MSCCRTCMRSVSQMNRWTLCIYYSIIDSAKKLLPRAVKCMILRRVESTLTKKKHRKGKMPSIAKKGLLRKNYKKQLFSSFKRQNQGKQQDQFVQ